MKPDPIIRTYRSIRITAVTIVLVTWSATTGSSAQVPATDAAVTVEVAKPKMQALTRDLRLPATLAPDEAVDLYAKVSGYVEMVNVDIGDRVTRGDLLVQIGVPEMMDELHQVEAVLKAREAKVRALQAKAVQAQRMVETAEAQVRRYEAEHVLGKINLKRKEELRQGNAIPEQALDEARSAHAITEAQLHIAEAEIAGAQAQKQAVDADVEVAQADVLVGQANLSHRKTLMKYARITAPFDGVITRRNVDHGTFVRSAADGTTAPLLRIAITDKIRMVLDIPEVDVPFVRVGTPVEIDVKALRTEPIRHEVTRMAGTLRVETRTMRVEVDIDNADGRITPGMYAQVAVKLGGNEQALVIPSKALRLRGKNTVVLVAANGKAKLKQVVVGYDDGILAEITSGLGIDEMVIVSGGSTVVSGTPVVVARQGS